MSPYKRNVVTGIVVTGALATLVWMMLTFSGRIMQIFKPPGVPVVFLSTRGDGLSDGSPVLFNGVRVGKVTSVAREADNLHVRVGGEIENVPPLPGNLSGKIVRTSYLGSGSQIELKIDGGIPSGALGKGVEIHVAFAGDGLIPPEAVELMDQVRRQKLVEHLDQTIVSMRVQMEKFGDVMSSTKSILGDNQVQTDLRSAIANVRTVTENFATLSKTANSTMADVRGAVAEARVTISKSNESLDRLTVAIGADLDKLGQVFTQFQEVSAKINNGKGTAGALVNDPKLYDELAMTAKELNVVAASLARLVDQWEHEGVSLKLAK